MAKAAKKSENKSTGKRTLIAPRGDKRFIKRDEKGQIKESDDQGKSLSRDVQRKSKTKVAPGYGDRGDQTKKSGAGAGALKKATAKKPAAKKAAAKKAAPKKAAPKKAGTKKASAKKAAPKKAAERAVSKKAAGKKSTGK